MCNRKCPCVTAGLLYPLTITSIICNVLLFFPGWSYEYLLEGNITTEVMCLGGLIGGIMVLIPAVNAHVPDKCVCCGKMFAIFQSVLFEALGVVGALYSFAVALSGLLNGPYCEAKGTWTTPFKDEPGSYLIHQDWWNKCTKPENVVQFHVILFSTLLAISGLKIILCASMCISGVCKGLCGFPFSLVRRLL